MIEIGPRDLAETIVLSRLDVAAIVDRVGLDALMDEVIARLQLEFEDFDPARIEVRKREGFCYESPAHGVLEWMPLMQADDFAVIKIVAYNPRNPELYGLPTIVSTTSLYHLATGHLVALADGVLPTAVRTGAASAVATRILAHPESAVVGLIGAGAQAVTQLHGLSRVLRIREALVYDVDLAAAESFASRTRCAGVPVRCVERSALERGSDVICTATSVEPGKGPVLEDAGLRPWLHVNAVGSDIPGKTEIPLSLLRRALVCPDFLPQAVVEGECQQLTAEEIGPNIIEVVRRGAQPAWQERLTVFDSTGFSLEDKVVLEVLWGHARRSGLGTRLPVEHLPRDAKDPYDFSDVRPAAAREGRR